MAKFRCQFPGCKYETDERNLIEYHHIIPIELNGINKDYNRLWLCPNHHKRIYIERAKSGVHSIKNKDSIIIKGKFLSTKGIVLQYINCIDNKENFYKIGKKND